MCCMARKNYIQKEKQFEWKCIAIYISYVLIYALYIILHMLCVYKSACKLNRSTPSKRCCLKRTDAQTDGWKLVQYVRNRNAAVFFFFYLFRITKMCVKPMNMMMIIMMMAKYVYFRQMRARDIFW